LAFQIQKRGRRNLEVRPEFEPVGENVVIGSTHWMDAEGRRRERFQVITLRDGMIADLQGCATRREAGRQAKRQARATA